MTYLYVEYPYFKQFFIYATGVSLIMMYNFNIFFHNKNMAFATKMLMGGLFFTSNVTYYKYRKQVLRCNLFDEYVQLRADELVKEREPLLRSETMKKWIWFTADLEETLLRVHRESFKNDATDFADSELLLQDFVRRYSDDTLDRPLSMANARIGHGF